MAGGFEEMLGEFKSLHEDIKEGKVDNELIASYMDRLSELLLSMCAELEALNERVDILTEAEESKG
jgi:DNA invertase Pin-like site-specific DNA recombinase